MSGVNTNWGADIPQVTISVPLSPLALAEWSEQKWCSSFVILPF